MNSITIHNLVFPVKAPYSEGHTLTAVEAAVLNQTRAENVGNGVRAKIKEALEEAQVSNGTELSPEKQQEISELFAKFDETYSFGVRRGRETDPVRALANQIAKDQIRTAFLRNGTKAADLTADVLNAQIEKNWDKHGERWMTEAKKALKVRQASLDTLDLS